jgi:hypothetical protein
MPLSGARVRRTMLRCCFISRCFNLPSFVLRTPLTVRVAAPLAVSLATARHST